jgi:hypothetical protein
MATIDPSQSTLSPNFAPYVYNYLSMGEAAAKQPFQPFTGQRFAGPSNLQTQAFSGLAGLQQPSQFQTASNLFTDAGTRAMGFGYTPSGTPSYGQVGSQNIFSQYQAPDAYQPGLFQNRFQGPGAYQPQGATSGFQMPSPYQAGNFSSGFGYQAGPATQFQNQFQGPGAYRPSTDFTQGIGGQSYNANQFQTGLGPVKSVQDYMSQYTGGVSDIAAREATRQADVSRQAEQGRLAQAGAFGGARQAIMEAERQRNLGTQIGDIRAKGLQEAYDRAQQQRLQEAGLGLEAQRATEGSRQFGASFGQQGLAQLLQARQMGEQSQQFGSQQDMQSRQLQAQYGLSAQQAQEAARQFNAGQALTAEQLQAQFGLDAQKAQEMSRQFGAQQAMTGAETGARLGLQAQQQTAQDRQFAAQQAMNAQQLQAQFGLSADQAAEASRQFGSGQRMTAAQLQAQFGMDAQKANQMASMQAQQYNQQAALEANRQAEASRQFGATYGMDALRQQLAAGQALAGLGQTQYGKQLEGLESLLRAGATQQQLAQQPLDFGYQQFQESMKYPMQQAQFMQSLAQGLPLQARPYNEGDSGLGSALSGGLSGLALFKALFPNG